MKRWDPMIYTTEHYGNGEPFESRNYAEMEEHPDGEYFLVSDVEAANAWRYDEPEEDGWYLVSLLGGLVSTAFRTRAGWNRTDVLAWRPLPEPAKEHE